MSYTFTKERALFCAHGWLLRNCFQCRRPLTPATVAFVLWHMVMSFAATANAVEANVRDDTLLALRNYVQLIDTRRKPPANVDQNSNSFAQNAAFAALRAFTERVGV